MLIDNCKIYCKDKPERIPQITIGEVWNDLINSFVIDPLSSSNKYQKMIIDQDMFTKDFEGHTKIKFIEKEKNLKNWHSITVESDLIEKTIILTKDTIVKVNKKGFIPVSNIEAGDTVPFWFYKSFFDIKVAVHESLEDIVTYTGYNLITDSKEFIGSGLIIMSNE